MAALCGGRVHRVPNLRLLLTCLCLGIFAGSYLGLAAEARSLKSKNVSSDQGNEATSATSAKSKDQNSASVVREKAAEGIDKESRRHEWPGEGPLGDSFRDVAKELRCPTCTGLSVLESDAAFSVQIKEIVKEQVEAGKSKEAILAYFTGRFGPWILRSPPVSGFNLWAWAVPVGLLVLGPPLIWWLIWRKRRVVSTFGVRPDEAIMGEMHERLGQLRAPHSQQKV